MTVNEPWNSWRSAYPLFVAHGAAAYARIASACMQEPAYAECPSPLSALHAIRLASFEGRATDPFTGDAQQFLADSARLSDEVQAAVAAGRVQFTDPLRAADLLPGLLLASRHSGGRPLRLIELGASAGLLLAPDRFTFDYPTGRWAGARSAAALQAPLDVPEDLLGQPLEIAEAVGIDLAPVDPRDPGSYDYLRSFTWPGDPAREDRLKAALRAVADDPVPLIAGNVLDVLPELLGSGGEQPTVVIESSLSTYLSSAQALRLGRLLDAASRRMPLLLLSRGAGTQPDWHTLTLLDLSNRRRTAYASSDVFSERSRWLG